VEPELHGLGAGRVPAGEPNLSMTEWDQLLPGVRYERTCPDLPAGDGAPPGAPAARYAD
jgi:hypothetical protein